MRGLDLFLPLSGKRPGVAFRCQYAPRMTRSMRIAVGDLDLDELWVVYPGTREYEQAEAVSVKPLCCVAARTAGGW